MFYDASVGFYRCTLFHILFCTFYAAFIREFSRFTLLKSSVLYLYSGAPSNFDGPAPPGTVRLPRRHDDSLACPRGRCLPRRGAEAHPSSSQGQSGAWVWANKACLRGNRSLQPALPLKMAEVQNDPAEIKLPPGSPGIELGFTSHVRASPL